MRVEMLRNASTVSSSMDLLFSWKVSPPRRTKTAKTISSTKQTPFTCLGIRKIFVWHEIWQIFQVSSHNLRKTLPKKNLISLFECESSGQKATRIFHFYPAIKGWGWKINLYLWMLHDSQLVLRILRVHYYGSQVYIRVEFPGPSTAKVVYPWDWRVVINKWLLKLTTCKFEGDKSSQDFCWSKTKRGQPSAQRPLGLNVCLR